MKTKRSSHEAAALVITLGFLVMITILVVALMEIMRIDRPAASSHFERMRAEQYAQAGIERLSATLGQFTSAPNAYWASAPGQLVVSATAGGTLAGVPLHSGSASATAGTASLNIPMLRNPASNVITGGGDPMSLQWIVLLNDGTPDRVLVYDASANPTGYYWKSNANFLPSKTNPIVGRYAYWADDESSKINYNTAWGRKSGNTNPPGSPTQIDLTALGELDEPELTGAMADALHAHITNDPGYQSLNNGFFNTPLDARRVEQDSPGIAAVLEKYKFSLTHYNHDPNTTVFNEPRIVLTTRPDRAGWTYKDGEWVGVNGLSGTAGTPYYIRILKDEGTASQPDTLSGANTTVASDPGLFANVDPAKIKETVDYIVPYLKRTDWPMVNGSGSFQSKYYPVGAASYPTAALSESRLMQLALNIVDYVRSKESPQLMAEPLRGNVVSGKFVLDEAAFSNNAFMGVARAPSITELGIWLGKDANGAKVVKLKAELYLPPAYGCSEFDLEPLKMYFSSNALSNDPAKTGDLYPFITWSSIVVSNPSNPANPYILKAGTYAVVTLTQPFNQPDPVQPTDYTIRVGLYSSGSGPYRLDMTPLSGTPLPLTTVTPGVAENAISSIEVDDPRINKHYRNWQKTATNTFGSVNSCSTIGQSPLSISPQQDTDGAGQISDASFYMPPPAGAVYTLPDGSVDDNTRGRVTSVGELGYIHTGVEMSPQALFSGTPWRTLRLQPNNQTDAVVPDWALMDLFTVPMFTPANAKPVFAPHGNSFAGRVNLNSLVQPFAAMTRTQSLAAVFMGTHPTRVGAAHSFQAAQTLALNVVNQTLAPNGKLYRYPGTYLSTGQVVEIEGIAEEGEASEHMVREIGNLLTVRGNVFSIYSVGQALKETNGNLIVTGERRLHVLLERYVDANGTLRFAPVYYRSLTP